MTSRFPEPWRIAEFPNGLAVYDAAGRQLGFFYGRTDPNMAGHGGFLMIDDARQIAADFARLPELLNQTSGRREAAASAQDDNSFEPEWRSSPQILRRPSNPSFKWMKFLIPIAVAALSAGYLFFGDDGSPVNVAVAPQVSTNLSAEFSPLAKAKAPVSKATDITVESPIEPNVQTSPSEPTVPLEIKPAENGIEVRPFTPSQGAPTCFPSASAVLQNYPEGRPSWTFRAPGHEGTKCWYPTRRTQGKR
jgi:hypothetical protein